MIWNSKPKTILNFKHFWLKKTFNSSLINRGEVINHKGPQFWRQELLQPQNLQLAWSDPCSHQWSIPIKAIQAFSLKSLCSRHYNPSKYHFAAHWQPPHEPMITTICSHTSSTSRAYYAITCSPSSKIFAVHFDNPLQPLIDYVCKY